MIDAHYTRGQRAAFQKLGLDVEDLPDYLENTKRRLRFQIQRLNAVAGFPAGSRIELPINYEV